jgi:GDPmannose 4,6-dehydratase
MKTAIITGVTGQDAAYLAELLLTKGYLVYGTYRRTSSNNFWRIEALGVKNHPNLVLIENDITDMGSIIRLLEKANADEIYNLAAQSFVWLSFKQPMATTCITAVGVLNFLEAIRIVNRNIRFYQASSSEMYGKAQAMPQDENTPFYPRSPYGVAKLYAHWMTINYRESYAIFASSGISFNHESPLRGLEFVTRKITHGLVKIKLGMISHLELGNLDARRDWGYAKDYVEGMWSMLQVARPDTFVLATGKTTSVREFVEIACRILDIKIAWQGTGSSEVGINTETSIKIIRVNPKYYRPTEVDILVGNADKAKKELGWRHKTTVEDLCALMVDADLRQVRLRANTAVLDSESC